MAQWIFACKEINGSVYITRLPQTISSTQPGVPDVWHFVGPGSRPSIQEYSGTKFVLTFEYLSHLFCRIVDTATWPPTQVNPVQVSGGPNPPTAFTYNIQLSQDSLTLKQEGNTAIGPGVAAYFDPPVYQTPLLFLDPITMTYSVTIQPVSTWFPQPPANTDVFFRFYARPFPYTGPWVLITDWTLIHKDVFNNPAQPFFSFPFSNVGSLRYQFSVTWGDQFDPMQPFNPAAHAEGIPGQTTITVDSTVQRASFQFILNESLTLKRSSYVVCPNLGAREAFINEGPFDEMQLSKSSLGTGGNTFSFFGTRQAFVNEAGSDTLSAAYLSSNSAIYNGGNALQAVMG